MAVKIEKSFRYAFGGFDVQLIEAGSEFADDHEVAIHAIKHGLGKEVATHKSVGAAKENKDAGRAPSNKSRPNIRRKVKRKAD